MPYDAVRATAARIIRDSSIAKTAWRGSARVLKGDARQIPKSISDESIDLVLTSPPYPNNSDYADATRLEMTFWGEIDSWSALHGAIRKDLLPSCSQHSSAERFDLDELLSNKELDPIRPSITKVCLELSKLRRERAGKKSYDSMIAAYFLGMSQTLRELRRVMRAGAPCLMVVGDSAPYGVHVPVEQWLADLAEDVGLRNSSFEKWRDRNTKWKNREHSVPLQEGVLMVWA